GALLAVSDRALHPFHVSLFLLCIIRRPPIFTLFPYTNALPISLAQRGGRGLGLRARRGRPLPPHAAAVSRQRLGAAVDEKQRQRSEEHTSELQSPDHLVCRLLLEKKKRPYRVTRFSGIRYPHSI